MSVQVRVYHMSNTNANIAKSKSDKLDRTQLHGARCSPRQCIMRRGKEAKSIGNNKILCQYCSAHCRYTITRIEVASLSDLCTGELVNMKRGGSLLSLHEIQINSIFTSIAMNEVKERQKFVLKSGTKSPLNVGGVECNFDATMFEHNVRCNLEYLSLKSYTDILIQYLVRLRCKFTSYTAIIY